MEKQIVFCPETLLYLTQIREILQQLPAVEEYLCFATPAFRVKKKLLARLQDDGLTLSVHADNRDIWIAQNPEVFFVTPAFFKLSYRFGKTKRCVPAIAKTGAC